MPNQVIVFLDAEYEVYFGVLANCLRSEYCIKRVYGIGNADGKVGDYEIIPLNDLQDDEDIYGVIILSNQSDNIRKLVSYILKNVKDEKVYSFQQVPEVLLNDMGKMLFLERIIEMNYPRPAKPHSIGAFTYYQNLQIFDELHSNDYRCTIGKFCAIGPNNVFLLGEEHYLNWGTIYPLDTRYKNMIGMPCNESTFSKGSIEIGSDVWTGYGVTILSGVTIGDGCIVGAGAVVTHSVEPYSILVGNPARVIRKRFSEDIISKMLEMKWWDWDYDRIFCARNLIQSEKIDELYRYYKDVVVDKRT